MKRVFFHVFFISCVALMVTLGTWQIIRYYEQQHYNETIKKQIFGEPFVATDQHRLAVDDMELFKSIKIQGHILTDSYIELSPKVNAKGHIGKEYVFVFSSPDIDGRFILVNVGWMPSSYQFNPKDIFNIETSIKGYIRHSGKSNPFVPDNNSIQNQWYYVNSKEIGNYLGYDVATSYMISTSNPLIKGQSALQKLPLKHIDHFKYSITWFSLAVIFFIGYIYICVFIGKP